VIIPRKTGTITGCRVKTGHHNDHIKLSQTLGESNLEIQTQRRYLGQQCKLNLCSEN